MDYPSSNSQQGVHGIPPAARREASSCNNNNNSSNASSVNTSEFPRRFPSSASFYSQPLSQRNDTTPHQQQHWMNNFETFSMQWPREHFTTMDSSGSTRILPPPADLLHNSDPFHQSRMDQSFMTPTPRASESFMGQQPGNFNFSANPPFDSRLASGPLPFPPTQPRSSPSWMTGHYLNNSGLPPMGHMEPPAPDYIGFPRSASHAPTDPLIDATWHLNYPENIDGSSNLHQNFFTTYPGSPASAHPFYQHARAHMPLHLQPLRPQIPVSHRTAQISNLRETRDQQQQPRQQQQQQQDQPLPPGPTVLPPMVFPPHHNRRSSVTAPRSTADPRSRNEVASTQVAASSTSSRRTSPRRDRALSTSQQPRHRQRRHDRSVNHSRRVANHDFLRSLQILRGTMSKRPIASRAFIKSLEPVDIQTLEEDDRLCQICYSDYNERRPDGDSEEAVRIPNCGHIFGKSCITTWFKDSSLCPYCRAELPQEFVYTSTNRRLAALLAKLGPVEAERNLDRFEWLNHDAILSLLAPEEAAHESFSSEEDDSTASSHLINYRARFRARPQPASADHHSVGDLDVSTDGYNSNGSPPAASPVHSDAGSASYGRFSPVLVPVNAE